ncbi:DUF6169 family protein [Elizabethkingia sp. M8]|uniref:DUF6169 family protein n=1 Tax=Elizabethkingia sp. M8 TaxID=2796140 RepID=UPI0019043599|nr:DUF6169 family protein [Elizabethkingia sp. M8]QQM26598.1 hypothetical protein JCR23_17430 [Elizabethkingia sp. M8]
MENQFKTYYTCSFDMEANTYEFETKNAILYRIAFILDESIFPPFSKVTENNVYNLVVEKTTPGTEPLDSKVSKTITFIIKEFFNNKKNSLLYICDPGDDRAEKRFNLFNRWYNDSDYKDFVIKKDSIFRSENETYYTGYLIHKENPDLSSLLNTYQDIKYTLSEKEDF